MNRLKEMRTEKNLSLDELSNLIQIPKTSLSNYERGEREPKIETWKQLANFFEVDPAYLMGLSQFKNINQLETSNSDLKYISDFLNSDNIMVPVALPIITDIASIFDSLLDDVTSKDGDEIQKIVSAIANIYSPDLKTDSDDYRIEELLEMQQIIIQTIQNKVIKETKNILFKDLFDDEIRN